MRGGRRSGRGPDPAWVARGAGGGGRKINRRAPAAHAEALAAGGDARSSAEPWKAGCCGHATPGAPARRFAAGAPLRPPIGPVAIDLLPRSLASVYLRATRNTGADAPG